MAGCYFISAWQDSLVLDCFLNFSVDNPTVVPFAVRRSHVNNLPVYLDYKNGRARIFTIIRNINGNIEVCVYKIQPNFIIIQQTRVLKTLIIPTCIKLIIVI